MAVAPEQLGRGESPSRTALPNAAFVLFCCSIFVAAAATVLTLSAMFWMKRHELNPLVSHSEFFVYSWLYGLRWGAGENIFVPHSQLILPIFALVDRIFDLTSGTPEHIIQGWAEVSFYWPLAMMSLALCIVFLTTDRKHPLSDVIFSSTIFIVSLPLFLEESALFSTSYHSLSIPLALAGLFFWKRYVADPSAAHSHLVFVCLGLYTACCVLGKPTFLAFAAPFFAMETVKVFRNPGFSGFAKLALAGLVAVVSYLVAIIAFYHHGLAGLNEHFQLSRMFMTSQYHWYDDAKGATPFHWYYSYVFKVMGPLPTILILISLILAWLSRRPLVVVSGVTFSYLSALFFLYERSQLHAHAEFISLAAATTIGAYRCSQVSDLFDSWFGAIGSRRALRIFYPVAAAVTAAVILLAWYPLNLLNTGYLAFVSKYDAPIINALFLKPAEVRTVAVMIYPNILYGAADAWCRGGGDIFTPHRSDFLDRKFGNVTCALNTQQADKDYSKYNRVLFLKPKAADMTDTTAVFLDKFPAIFRRLGACRTATDQLPGESILTECELKPAEVVLN